MTDNDEMLRRAKHLRRELTPQERMLWYRFLRYYPIKFRRQHTMGPFILDFYCVKASLVIEIDGDQHFETKNQTYDEKRTKFLDRRGILVVRYRNKEIDHNLTYICDQIDMLVRSRT